MWWIYDDAWFLAGRFCCDCSTYLPFEDYKALRHGWNGTHSRCRLCDNANSKLLYQLKKHYPYPQDGRCEYCLQTSSKPLHLDHNHDTDEFKGWLCHKCNRTLGGFYDDIDILTRALEYVKTVNRRSPLYPKP